MINKPKILIFIDWFLPGYKAGGPIKSVSNIVNSLHLDVDFLIVTSDRDLNETAAYENIQLNTILRKDHFSIIYLTPDERDAWIKNHLNTVHYDGYYFNSLFSKKFTIKPLSILNKLGNKKIIVAPRGMLGKGALSIKPLKKKLFLFVAKLIGTYKSVIWHATNEDERNDIQLVFGSKASAIIASNISLCVIDKKEIIKKNNDLKLVFFSRISPKKNLLYALDLMKELDNVSLDIYGSIEDHTYWNKCKELIGNNNIKASYKGEILPINVTSVLSNYHFFILPTLHENYGHVIVEALTAGCGLIISNNTPWKQLKQKKIGWEIELQNKTEFITTLKKCLEMDQYDYNVIRNNCYSFVKQEINTSKEIEDTKQLFI